ncbi:MAG: aldo/keto reductase family protein [Myxococcota bacterium]
MNYRRLGASGLVVSEVALGSWLTLGGHVDAGASERIARHAFDLGVTLFDTADAYSNGEAERVLGRALAGLPRTRLVLATKCFFPMSDDPNDRGLSRKHLFESVHASLRRLGTDYLDLHQCHRADPETPLEETVRAYEDLIRQGKVLYWGLSQWSEDLAARACRIADATGGYRPISNQPQYSLLSRWIEHGLLDAQARLGVGQIVWSPLAQGVLTGKYAGGAKPEGSGITVAARARFLDPLLTEANLARVERMRSVAQELGVTPAQLALAWCLRRPEVASVIVGATRFEQLDENVLASGLTLPRATRAKLERIFGR